MLLTSADDTLHILMVISIWKLISKKEVLSMLSSLATKVASCIDFLLYQLNYSYNSHLEDLSDALRLGRVRVETFSLQKVFIVET